MIGMVHPLVVHEEHRRIVSHHDLGLKSANGVGDPFAESQARLDLAIGLIQEVDTRHAELCGRSALLPLAPSGQLAWVDRGVVASLVSPGDEQVAHLGASVHPARHGAGGPELDVVRMRGDHEHPVRGRQPVDRHRSGDPCR